MYKKSQHGSSHDTVVKERRVNKGINEVQK